MSQAKDQDQSMEEILQSIKRIIAEEGTPATGGSDVLELTDMLGEDPVETPPGFDAPEAPAMPTLSIDEIMAAPLSSGPITIPEPAPEPEPKPEPKPEPVIAPEPEPVFAAPASAPTPAPAPIVATVEESLVSDITLHSATAALSALKNIPETSLPPLPASGVGFRSGTTIEDLVLESLKPMLKDWLDANLTGIVERLVEKEVRKLSAR